MYPHRLLSSALLFVPVALCASAWIHAHTNSSSQLVYELHWELLPSGYLEPIVRSGGVPVRLETLDVESLLPGLNEPETFPACYVLLEMKRGYSTELPASRDFSAVTGRFGKLTVAVVYTRVDSHLQKDVTYPRLESEMRHVRLFADWLLKKRRDLTVAEKIWSSDAEWIPVDGSKVSVSVDWVSLTPRLVGRPVHKELLPNDRVLNPSVQLLFEKNWIGYHLLLSQRYLPRSQEFETRSDGYVINANGLHAKLVRDGDGWHLTYPTELRDHASIVEFWSNWFTAH